MMKFLYILMMLAVGIVAVGVSSTANAASVSFVIGTPTTYEYMGTTYVFIEGYADDLIYGPGGHEIELLDDLVGNSTYDDYGDGYFQFNIEYNSAYDLNLEHIRIIDFISGYSQQSFTYPIP